jgi:uncharacterized protein (UPF0332 family)
MDQIKWCIKQKKGIELVESSDNLRDAYLMKAEDALDTLKTSKSRDWQLTTAYYTIYNGLYSLLMKIGIKCEIHSCTIEFTKRFLNDHFSLQDFELIDKAFSARIDSQYYVNREVPDQNYDLIMRKTPLFLVKCKNIVLDEKEIQDVRKKILQAK